MLLYGIQIFSFLAVILASICKDKKNILLWVFLANLSNFLVLLVAKELDGWVGSLITVFRSLLFLNKDKIHKNELGQFFKKTHFILIFCIMLHIIAFILSYQDIFSICILFATITVCITQWFGNPIQIKIGAIISLILWIIYTLHIELYMDLPKRFVELLFLTISLISLIKKPKDIK